MSACWSETFQFVLIKMFWNLTKNCYIPNVNFEPILLPRNHFWSHPIRSSHHLLRFEILKEKYWNNQKSKSGPSVCVCSSLKDSFSKATHFYRKPFQLYLRPFTSDNDITHGIQLIVMMSNMFHHDVTRVSSWRHTCFIMTSHVFQHDVTHVSSWHHIMTPNVFHNDITHGSLSLWRHTYHIIVNHYLEYFVTDPHPSNCFLWNKKSISNLLTFFIILFISWKPILCILFEIGY